MMYLLLHYWRKRLFGVQYSSFLASVFVVILTEYEGALATVPE